MKKIISLLIMLISCMTLNVNAKSFNTSISGASNFTNEITLTVSVNGFNEFDALKGFVGKLEYDSSKIEVVSINALNGFTLVNGAKLTMYNSSVTTGSNILQIKIKNKGLSSNESATISLTNIVGSDGDSDISSSNASKVIKYVEETTTTTTTTKSTTKTTTSSKSTSKTTTKATTSEVSDPKTSTTTIISGDEETTTKLITEDEINMEEKVENSENSNSSTIIAMLSCLSGFLACVCAFLIIKNKR